MKKYNLNDNMVYATRTNFTFGLEDDKSRQFGILFELTDMLDATGDGQFEQYPFIVSASIVPHKISKSFAQEGSTTRGELLQDAIIYMGGVPVDHVLVNDINGGLDEIAKKFNINEASVTTEKVQYGTVAAQNGKGSTHKYLQFKDEKSAHKYIDFLIQERTGAMGMLIGFILDRPINMMGSDGWETMRGLVKGVK